MDWDNLIERHGRAFILYARQWTQSHADAEDIVQTAIIRLSRSLPPEREIPIGLIYKAIRSRALDHHRSCRRRQAREEIAAELLYEDRMLEKTKSDELSEKVELALRKLPEDQREVVILKIWGALTFREISDSLEISLNTVTSRYRYAINKLQSELK